MGWPSTLDFGLGLVNITGILPPHVKTFQNNNQEPGNFTPVADDKWIF